MRGDRNKNMQGYSDIRVGKKNTSKTMVKKSACVFPQKRVLCPWLGLSLSSGLLGDKAEKRHYLKGGDTSTMRITKSDGWLNDAKPFRVATDTATVNLSRSSTRDQEMDRKYPHRSFESRC